MMNLENCGMRATKGGKPTDYVIATICDLNGIFRGKRCEADQLAKLERDGVRIPMSSIGVEVWGCDAVGSGLTLGRGDTDGIRRPTGRGALPILADAGRAALLPLWMELEDGTLFFSDARRMLAHVLARFEARGLTPVVATELEFHLVEACAEGLAPARFGAETLSGDLDNIYSVAEIDQSAAFFDEVYELADRAGIDIESAISEGGPRQFELTLKHRADALRIADDTLYLKQILRSVAARHGVEANFMAKPFAERSGMGEIRIGARMFTILEGEHGDRAEFK